MHAFVRNFPEWTTGLMNRCLDAGYFPKSWKAAVVKIIQKPGRDDYTNLSSFRPIGLLPVFGKLLEKLFVRRLTFAAQTQHQWSNKQYGFRQQTSTVDALRTLMQKIADAKQRKQHVIGVSLDIKAAFDNAWWPALMERLRRTRCPGNVHRLISSYLDERTVNLDYADAHCSKSMTKGCVQGSVCGPTFWNLVLDELLCVQLPDGCHIQAYADDVMLLAEGNSVDEVEAAANAALEAIYEWGRSVKLTFSAAKTQAIAFTSKSKSASVSMDDHPIPFRPDIKLLGVILDANLNFIKHVRYVLQKVGRTFKLLCKYVRPTWGVHPENVEILWHHVIVPTITYASGIWGAAAERSSVQKMLRTFQRSFAIRCIRGFHTVSAVAASALAGFIPLHLKIKETYRIECVKASGRFEDLPDDVTLEQRVRPESLLHPSKRVTISSSSAETQTQADAAASETNIFTDGSKLESGDTGCAFVIFHPSGRQEPRKFRLEAACSVFQAELFALDAATQWTRKHAKSDVTVYSDSSSALSAIKDRSNTNPLVASIHRSLSETSGRINVRFVWVRAHIGIIGNEAADAAAKEAATQKRGKVYTCFPLSYAKHFIRTQSLDAWQQEYSSAETGSTTRLFFPTIDSISKFRSSVAASFEMTQILTGHGFHRQYLHRFKIASTDACPCQPDAVQDVHHLLTSCNRFYPRTQDFAAKCAAEDVDVWDLAAVSTRPWLLDAFVLLVNTIVGTLKSFNS